jgi:hypothetical protein
MVDEKPGWDALDWNEQGSYRDIWQTLAHALMNFGVSKTREIS